MSINSNEIQQAISDFIIGQIANANSPQAANLAWNIKQAIIQYRADGGEFENAFSVDAQYDREDNTFTAQVSFTEDDTKTIMYRKDTDNVMVNKIYTLDDADDELCRLAGLMLSEEWVEGFAANGWKTREEEYQERERERCEAEAAIEKTRTEKHWSEL